MWAASPTRNSAPKRIGSATKLLSGAIDFSIDGPVCDASAAISGPSRVVSASQNRSSLQSSTASSAGHCT